MRLTSDISMTLANVDVVQKRNDAAVYRWENLVPNSPKPIIPPKSTAKVEYSIAQKTLRSFRSTRTISPSGMYC